MDSKYFRGKKAIQSLRHFTKIRLWYSVTAPWMSVLAQAQPKDTGCLWKQQAQWNSSFSGQKGMRIVLPIHFRLVDVGQGYLSPVPAAHKGAKQLEFTEMLLQDCHTRLFCEYPSCCTPCCLRLGIPVWQQGPRSACWLPETHRHSKHTVQVPHQLQQQHWESAAPR